jgi:hypothetical protein
MLQEGTEFAGAFQKLLREVAANAFGVLHRDPLIADTEFSSLYSSAEIVSGISAAEGAGLSVEQRRHPLCHVIGRDRSGIAEARRDSSAAQQEAYAETKGTSAYAFSGVQLCM